MVNLDSTGLIKRVFRKYGDNDDITDVEELRCDACGRLKPDEDPSEDCPCGIGEFWE